MNKESYQGEFITGYKITKNKTSLQINSIINLGQKILIYFRYLKSILKNSVFLQSRALVFFLFVHGYKHWKNSYFLSNILCHEHLTDCGNTLKERVTSRGSVRQRVHDIVH